MTMMKGMHYRAGAEHLWIPLLVLFDDFERRQNQVFKWETSDYSDKVNMKLIDGLFPSPKRPNGKEWDWVDFKVKEEDIWKEDRLPFQSEEKSPPPNISLAERELKTPPPKVIPPSPSVTSTPLVKPRVQYFRGPMPENEQFRLDEYAELNSEGLSQGQKRSRKENPEASLDASVTAKGRKKFKTNGGSWKTSAGGGSRASENVRASGSCNLMIRRTTNGEYGVINDFDLAAIDIMTPGQASPTKQGFERTGTKPFMAITLLQAELGEVVQHRWAHDLESVVWCIAWYVLLGIVDWQESTYRQVGRIKREWLGRVGPRELPEHYRAGTGHLWAPLANTAFEWNIRQDRVYKRLSPYSDKANMELMNGFFPCPNKRPGGEEWDWMDFKVKEEDIRKEDGVIVESK